MKTVSSFHRVASDGEAEELVGVQFEGKELSLPEGANLAACLLAAGVRVFRNTPVSGAPRGPYCMMGVCFDCLIMVDGTTQQACQCQVRKGMTIDAMPATEEEDGHA